MSPARAALTVIAALMASAAAAQPAPMSEDLEAARTRPGHRSTQHGHAVRTDAAEGTLPGRCARATMPEQHSHMSEVYAINAVESRLGDEILEFVKTKK